MSQKAILIIDYTNDFVATNGALTCKEPAQKIEKRIVHLTNHFLQNGEFVVMAVDAHKEIDPFHPESKLYPPHNIIGSEGRQLYGELHSLYKQKEASIYWMDKTRYSAFEGTDLALQLHTRGIRQIHLVGTCTDICILHTAVSAWYLGFEVIIHEDAVASFNPVGHDWALQHFKNQMGIQVVNHY
ncbi:isochorismatase [Brevibacillus laterosporus]|uniref:cysteine hydrolase family protein n=1 Tax=Brevibacillus laterosporus TaxID=1465 RepID=UPI000BD81BBB|nr:isochorismatase family cysteine hydrolase [Brevibacillus laterosporus]PCN46084.1 isochorismatase [Brevibacillus laterosporus]